LRLGDPDTLSKVVDLMKLTGNRQVRIIAHTDSLGAAEYSRRLSERQAAAIKRYLVENRGLAATQMSAEGVGDSTPIASDATVDGRSANRRVDFLILN
jgi:OmpA-OmpF porin, OOP family